jgi:general secretion pathway protein G
MAKSKSLRTCPFGTSQTSQNEVCGSRAEGFSLLEMVMVVTLILIVATISAPIYRTITIRTREALLRDHLFTLRTVIDRFTLDNGR